jgi:hypothetical protein
MCSTEGIDEPRATELAQVMHKAGIIVHFANSSDPVLRRTLFLRPEDIVHAMYSALDLYGTLRSECQEELGKIQKDLAPLIEKKSIYDKLAERSAHRTLNFGLLVLVAQFAGMARLVWWELSWDIMEPITYFLNFATAIGFYVYFVFGKRDFTYESFLSQSIEKHRNRYYKKNSFDVEKVITAEKRIAELEREIARLGKPLLHSIGDVMPSRKPQQ